MTPIEYEQAQRELRDLQDRLERLQKDHPLGEKGSRMRVIVN